MLLRKLSNTLLLQTTVPYLNLSFLIAFGAALMLGIAKSGIKGLAVLDRYGIGTGLRCQRINGNIDALTDLRRHIGGDLLQATCKVDLSYQTFTLDGSRGLDWGGFG